MMTRKPLALLLTLCLLIPPGVFALGIGRIQVNSALNQPFDAEIPLNSIGDVDLERLTVDLAPPGAFSQAGIERPPILLDLEFSVQVQPDGDVVVEATSTRPIREPILDFLVELEWPQGRLVREFVVFLEPPAAMRRLPERAPPAARPAPESRVTAAPSTTTPERGTETYGPVPYGDTLWNIARRVRPHPAISMQEMMQALLEANPQAFSRPDIDYLLAGTTLRIPSAGEIDSRYAGLADTQTQPAMTQPPSPAGERVSAAPSPERLPDQLRLVPPDEVDERQPGAPTARTEAEPTPPVAAEQPPAPALTSSSRIALDNGRPQLRLAGLDDLRSTLAQVDIAPPPAEQTAQAEPEPAPSVQETPAPETVTEPEVAFQETLPGEETPFQQIPEETGIAPPSEVEEEAAEVTPPEATLEAPEAEITTDRLADEETPPEPAFEETLPDVAQIEPPPEETGLETAQPEAPEEETQPSETAEVGEEQPQQPAETTDAATEAPVAEETATTTETTEPGAPAEDVDQQVGMMDTVRDALRNPQVLAIVGLVLLLLTALIVLLIRRSRKSSEVEDLAFELSGQEEQKATGAPVAGTDETVAEPVAEKPRPFRPLRSSLERVDLLLAVGNYAEAERVLHQAFDRDPSNVQLAAKLLDVHHASGNAEGFLKEAQALQPKVDQNDPLWNHVVQMGREFYPDHALFGGAKATEEAKAADRAEPVEESAAKSDQVTGGVGASAAPGGEEGLDWKLPDVEPPTATSTRVGEEGSEEEPKTQRADMDFELSEESTVGKDEPLKEEEEPEDEGSQSTLNELDWQLPDMEPRTATSTPSRETETESKAPEADFEQGLDFEFEGVASEETVEQNLQEPSVRVQKDVSSEEPPSTKLDELDWQLPDMEPQTATSKSNREADGETETQLESLDFGLQESEGEKASGEAEEESGSSASEDYVETKLDLALAYLDMGDSVGARSLLEEVLEEGNAQQKKRAEEYMSRLE